MRSSNRIAVSHSAAMERKCAVFTGIRYAMRKRRVHGTGDSRRTYCGPATRCSSHPRGRSSHLARRRDHAHRGKCRHWRRYHSPERALLCACGNHQIPRSDCPRLRLSRGLVEGGLSHGGKGTLRVICSQLSLIWKRGWGQLMTGPRWRRGDAELAQRFSLLGKSNNAALRTVST